MGDSILLRTKFLIPQAGNSHLSRPILASKICDSEPVPCVLVIAPAGYGKTSVLMDVATSYQHPLTWLQLDEGDNDPATFMAYLIEGARHQLSNLSVPTLDADDTISPERSLIILLNQLLEYPNQRWMLILDDYHIIHNPTVHKLVTTLIENLPSPMRVVIASRITPVLPLARWRARTQLLELRTNHLRFSQDETEAWLDLQSLSLPEELVEQLVEKTEGWGAGLQLATALFDDQVDNAPLIERITGTQPYIFDYLMEEVFSRQSTEIQSFLLESSVFTELNPAMCEAVIGLQDVRNMLTQLEKHNLFISRLNYEQVWYRYHQLFRDFLINRLKAQQPECYADIQIKAGDYFAQHAQSDIAIHHYLNAEQEAKAIEMLCQFADQYLVQGRVDELQSYLHMISPEQRHTSAPLQLIQARLLRYNGQLGGAINQLHDILNKTADDATRCRSYIELSAIRQSQGQYQHAYDMATQSVVIGERLDVCDYVPALMQMARCAGFIKGMTEGYQLAQQAYTIMQTHTHQFSAYDRAQLLHMLGQICWWHGNVQSAIDYCRSALTLLDDTNTSLKAHLLITLSTPTLYQKDYATALHLAEQAIDICQELQLKETLPAAYSALGNVLTHTGELERAESCLRTSIAQAISIGGARYSQVMAAGYLAQNLALQGRLDEAQAITQNALINYETQPTVYDVYVCRSVLADLLLETHQLHEAKTIFSNLVSVGETTQYRIPLAMAYFGLAYILMQEQQQEEAIYYSEQSLKLLEPAMLHQLYLDQRERALQLCEHLMHHLPNNTFVQQVYQSLHTLADSPPPALSISTPDLIHIKTFGGLRVFYHQREIEPKAFSSAKARELLAYFVTLRSKSVNLDRAVSALWEDDTGSMSAFHTALYRLRVALRQKGNKDKFILSEVGEYRLDSSKFDLDVEQFDNLLQRALHEFDTAKQVTLYEQALRLYQGDYLENFHHDWLIIERERLERDYLQGIDKLSQLLIADGQFQQASEWQYQALDIDPYNESLHSRYMETLYQLGNQQKLIDHYAYLKKLLLDAFGTDPLPETQQTYEGLITP